MKLIQVAWRAIPVCLLLYTAQGYAETCTQEQLNQKACKANQTVQCVKQFAPAQGKFIYRWEFVNQFDQVFEAPPAMLGKTQGYTPKACDPSKFHVAESEVKMHKHN